MIREPAARPCGSCPYRRDTPSGVWDETEYEKLPRFDGETALQDPSVFMCHRQDGRLCAGWCGTHDMADSFGLRLAALTGQIDQETVEKVLDYTTDVPLYATGQEAYEAGIQAVECPSVKAIKVIQKLEKKI